MGKRMSHSGTEPNKQDLSSQIDLLTAIVVQNQPISDVLTRAASLHIDQYYIGAGCITQSVWNYLSGFPLDYGIKDIDFVYYDESDLSEEAENEMIRRLNHEFGDLAIKLDIKNQARVHLWYKNHFGYEIQPYKSLEDAIDTWPTTSSAVGIRKQGNAWKVYAPFGLDDLFGMVVRANKAQITREIYGQKTTNWSSKWSKLVIIPWDEEQVRIYDKS
jgi:hypothetical protein